MTEQTDAREAAIRRLVAKRGFWTHAFIYALVNSLLVAVWYFSPTTYFWPIWAMAGWGIGLAMHAWGVFFQRGITEEEIRREMERGR